MLSYLTLKNFKCFEEQSFALGNLTIVAGANGAGKSTLIQALMLLRQSDLDKRTLLSEKVQLRGSLVNLKSADAIRYFESEDTDITISIEDDTIDEALDVIECFNDNFILDKIPDPSINQIEACVRNHKQVDQIEYVFYDYIFSSPGLLSEFKSNNLREDMCKRMSSYIPFPLIGGVM